LHTTSLDEEDARGLRFLSRYYDYLL
jgi:hypothetical protein